MSLCAPTIKIPLFLFLFIFALSVIKLKALCMLGKLHSGLLDGFTSRSDFRFLLLKSWKGVRPDSGLD